MDTDFVHRVLADYQRDVLRPALGEGSVAKTLLSGLEGILLSALEDQQPSSVPLSEQVVTVSRLHAFAHQRGFSKVMAHRLYGALALFERDQGRYFPLFRNEDLLHLYKHLEPTPDPKYAGVMCYSRSRAPKNLGEVCFKFLRAYLLNLGLITS